jgi:hypothetical protein
VQNGDVRALSLPLLFFGFMTYEFPCCFFKPALQVNFEWLGAFKKSGLRYEWFCAV